MQDRVDEIVTDPNAWFKAGTESPVRLGFVPSVGLVHDGMESAHVIERFLDTLEIVKYIALLFTLPKGYSVNPIRQ